MFALQKSKTKASSRTQIALRGVRDGILILPGNQYRAVLEVSAVNFELKSEEEQDAIIDSYESFLNSIGHPLQILVRTRQLDMEKYLLDVTERCSGETEPIYKTQLEHYTEFIRSLISSNTILTRQFFIVVPFSATDSKDFDSVKDQLRVRLDITSKGLLRMGLHSSELSSLALLDLFYGFYSPMQSRMQPLTEQLLQAIHTELTIAKNERS